MRLSNSSAKPLLVAGSLVTLISLSANVQAVDGTWGVNATGLYSATGNWVGGIVPGGADSTLFQVYDSTVDANSTLQLDQTAITLGGLYMADIDGNNSSSMAVNNASTNSTVLTLQTTTGTPVIDVGMILNNGTGGKKAIIGSATGGTLTLAGTQGFNKTGLGMLSLRGPNTMTGTVDVQGGLLDFRVAMNTNFNVSGGTLNVDFGNSGGTTSNLINSARTLTLGGAKGSGFVTVGASAAILSQTLAGLTVNSGGNSITATGNSATNTFTWNLGTVTHNSGSLNLASTNGIFNFTSGGSITGNDASGIVGGWLTYASNDWARANGTTLNNTGVPYTANTWGTNVNTNVTALNFLPLPGQNSISNGTTHTLRFNDGFSHFMALSGTNTIETGGILFGNLNNSATQLNGGSIQPAAGVSELSVHAISTGDGWGSVINSDIVDNGAAVNLMIDGPGSLVLDGNKSFTGTTYVGGIQNATSFGNAPVQGAGTLVLGKALGGSATGSVGGAIVNDGVVAFNRSGTYTVPNTITGSGSVAQWSEGTLVLNKTISNGGLDLRNGTTNLDFSAAGAPTSNIVPAGIQTTNGIWTDPGRLTLRDTTLNVMGAAGANNTQTFGLTDIQGSTSVNLVPGSGGTVNLNLGAYARPNNNTDGAGVLKASLPAGATLTVPVSYPGAANSLVADNGQAFVTVNGTDWGAKNATNTQIVAGSSIGGFYTNLSALTASSNADYNVDTAVAAGVTLGSLRFNTVAAPATLTVNSGQILRLGGVLVTPNAAASTTIAGPGSITAAATGGRDLTIFQNSGQTLTISAVIADNTVSTGVTNVVKEGSGTLVMSGANTYAGKTYVQGGLLDVTAGNIGSATTAAGNIFVREGEMRVGGTATVATGANFVSIGQRLGEVGTLTLRNSAVWTTAADFNVADVAATGTLNVQDTATLNVNNFYVGKAGGSATGTVNLSGGAINITTGSSDVRIGGNNVGGALAQGTINQTGGAMNVSRNFQLGAYGVGTYNQSGGSYTANTGFVGIGRFQSGVGTWNLSGNASITATAAASGSAFIVAEQGRGTLNISGNSILNAKSLSVAHNSGVGDVVQTGGTVNLNATGTIAFGGTFQNGVILAPQGTGIGSYTLSGGTLSTQAISGGTGTSNFTFDGGTLKPIASNATFITGITTANVKGGAVIDTSGFNVSVLSNLQHDASGSAIDGGLTKNGLGVLTLAGTNSYTGLTAITNGSVLVNGSITSTSGVTVGNGGLIGGSGIVTTASNGNVTVAAGGKISPGNSPGNLSFALGSGVFDISAVGATSIGSLVFELGTSSDKVTLNSGTLSLGSGQLGFNDFTFSDSGGLVEGVYTLFDANSAFLGSLDSGNLSGSLPGGLTGTLVVDTAGNNLNLNVVPEPGTLALVLAGLGLGFRRRRSSK